MSFAEDVRYVVEKGQSWVGMDNNMNPVTPRFQNRYILTEFCCGKKLKPVGEYKGQQAYAVIFDLDELNDKENDSEFNVFFRNSRNSEASQEERQQVGIKTN